MHYRHRAKPGKHMIDDQYVRTDSIMEATIIRRLVSRGFSGKWRRPRAGLAYGFSNYTPDVELCILHDSMNRRALVEFKAFSVSEFEPRRRRAMLGAAKFYSDTLCMLYTEKNGQWYIIEPRGELSKTSEPTPGGISIDQLPRPRLSIPIYNAYGRRYVTRPVVFMAKTTADGLEFFVKTFFYSAKKRHTKRKL